MKKEAIKSAEVTPDMIAGWKESYGDVFCLEVGEETVYLRTPRRNEIGAATTMAKGNPAKFSEVLLKSCWLAGDADKVFGDEALLNAAASHLDELVPMAQSSLKKL
jgi:hypothetical protein